ncbi:retrovirus-related Pol polyprotein from transposon 297 [Trichonephila clavipes]|nr:retrovirus-related Pol polyprotein from transposon 297 [Trichonephila clavipes]
MAPHKRRKSETTEYAADEEDMTIYVMEEDEREPISADKYVMINMSILTNICACHIKIMYDPSSFTNPTPLAHTDTSTDVLPRGEVLAKFEERYSCKATLGSRNSNNVEGRGRNERRISNVGNNRGNWRNSEVVHRPNNGRNDYRGNYENNRQGNKWFESWNRFQNDDRRFNDRGYKFRNRGQNDDFSRRDQRYRGSSENFCRGSRKQMGRLNVLKVSDIKGGGSKIILDFDRKSLAIPDSQINKVVKTVEIEKVEIDLSKTKLEEKQKRELQDLFNSFQGLFSDKPGLKHVLYYEIDTGDNPPVVSRPYKYVRVKQEILDYHVDKMLNEGTIIPIQSPYAPPVVLSRKNNGLHRRIFRKHIDLLLIIGN